MKMAHPGTYGVVPLGGMTLLQEVSHYSGLQGLRSSSHAQCYSLPLSVAPNVETPVNFPAPSLSACCHIFCYDSNRLSPS